MSLSLGKLSLVSFIFLFMQLYMLSTFLSPLFRPLNHLPDSATITKFHQIALDFSRSSAGYSPYCIPQFDLSFHIVLSLLSVVNGLLHKYVIWHLQNISSSTGFNLHIVLTLSDATLLTLGFRKLVFTAQKLNVFNNRLHTNFPYSLNTNWMK